MKDKPKYQTGLVLSGGAARGFAHLGVMRYLNQKGIFPDVISGVSAGAIAGAFYADGYVPEEIIEIFYKKKIFHFVKMALPTTGLLEISGLKKVLAKNLRAKRFENLQMPFFVCVTNYNSGQTYYLNKGSIIDAILASSSIPILFKPHVIKGDMYIDGGVTDNLPVEPIKSQCEKIIAVNAMPVGDAPQTKNMITLAMRTFNLNVAAFAQNIRKDVDLLIEPMELKNYWFFDVVKGMEMVEVGYNACKRVFENPDLSKAAS